MHLNQKIIETLDESDLNKFINLVYKAVILFDKNVGKEYDVSFTDIVSLSASVYNKWHVPEYNMPLFRLLAIEDNQDRSVVVHYAKSTTIYFDRTRPNDESLLSFDHVLFFSFKTDEMLTILNDEFSELYDLLVKENLLFPVTSELQKIILLSC